MFPAGKKQKTEKVLSQRSLSAAAGTCSAEAWGMILVSVHGGMHMFHDKESGSVTGNMT